MDKKTEIEAATFRRIIRHLQDCLLYTSDAADEWTGVDLGGGRIIKPWIKKQKLKQLHLDG